MEDFDSRLQRIEKVLGIPHDQPPRSGTATRGDVEDLCSSVRSDVKDAMVRQKCADRAFNAGFVFGVGTAAVVASLIAAIVLSGPSA